MMPTTFAENSQSAYFKAQLDVDREVVVAVPAIIHPAPVRGHCLSLKFPTGFESRTDSAPL